VIFLLPASLSFVKFSVFSSTCHRVIVVYFFCSVLQSAPLKSRGPSCFSRTPLSSDQFFFVSTAVPIFAYFYPLDKQTFFVASFLLMPLLVFPPVFERFPPLREEDPLTFSYPSNPLHFFSSLSAITPPPFSTSFGTTAKKR